jgi:pimeloyl-ACP methyl ester carboxylesterase
VPSFDGTELAVHVVGPGSPSGPAIVFAHGFSQNLTGWHYQWKHFSARYRCVLYDQRGHGRSAPAVDGDYSLEALARDLSAVLDAEVPAGPAVLVGHSMGGMAVISLAASRPEEFGSRVRGVVLADTAAGQIVQQALGGLASRLGRIYLPPVRLLGRRPRAAARVRTAAFRGRADLAFLVARATNFGPGASPSVIDHVVRMSAETPAEVWTDLAVAMLGMDLQDALDDIAVPTLVIVGEHDRLTPVSSARTLAERAPHGQLVVVEGAGHAAPIERPDAWNGAVEAFLRPLLRTARSDRRASA